MRTRYYYSSDTGIAYKVTGGVCPAKLDEQLCSLFGAKRTTVLTLGRYLNRDMTRFHEWKPMWFPGGSVSLYFGC